MNETHFNITSLFFEAAEKYPDKAAIIENNHRISYFELKQKVLETSASLKAKGIKKGDRVLVFIPMSIDLYKIVLSIFHIGATAVFLDEWVSKNRMETCCQIANCQAFIGIFKARVYSLFSTALRKIPIKTGVRHSTRERNFSEGTETFASDTALITFTTGSTGIPKAAKRTHGFLYEQFTALQDKLNPQESDINMPVLPIVLLINLGVGCTSVIADAKAAKPGKMMAERIYLQLKNEKVNRLVASPHFIKVIAEYTIKQELTLPALAYIFTGGAPVFPPEAKLYRTAFHNATIEILYGSTEAEPISAVSADELINTVSGGKQNGLLVGSAYHKTKVRIIRITEEPVICKSAEDLEAITLEENEIGEIIVSGPHVLREYFNNEKAIKQNKINIGETCWHRSGDSGYLKNGSLYLTGRCTALIKTGSEMISPFICEQKLQSIQGIERGTVIENHDKIIIIIQVSKITNKNLIKEKIRATGLHYNEIKFISKIPLDPRHHSKIDYEKLKKLLVN